MPVLLAVVVAIILGGGAFLLGGWVAHPLLVRPMFKELYGEQLGERIYEAAKKAFPRIYFMNKRQFRVYMESCGVPASLFLQHEKER